MGSNEFVVSTANFGGDFLRDATLGVGFRWISCGFENKWKVFPFSFLRLGRNVCLSLFKAGKFVGTFCVAVVPSPQPSEVFGSAVCSGATLHRAVLML